jgi:TolB-like protein
MAEARSSGKGAFSPRAVFLVALVASEGWARLSPDHRSVRRRLVGAIAGSPSPLAHPVIAVLPFKNLGSATGSDLLVDSLTTGLIRQLGVIDGLQVRSQESSFRVSAQDLADVGRRLSVNLVIQGDARVSADKLVVNAALHSVADGSALWSYTVDRELKSEGDVVAVTEELTRTIVNRLRLKLGPTQRRYDTDIPTLQMYLKARALRDARGQRGVESIALFEEVIRRDPTYAPAKAALAAMYGELASVYPYAEFKPAAGPMPVQGGIRLSEAIELMEPLTRSALEIDPLLAQAHAAQGFVHAMMLRWTEAEASFRRAIEVEPNCTSLYGDFVLSVLLPWGRVDESLTLLRNALDADPESLDLLRTLAYAQLGAGQYEAARDNARRVLSVDPTFPHMTDHLRWALLFNGERAEVLAMFEEFADGRPGVPGYIHAIYGRRAEAEAIAAKFGHIPQRQAEIYGLLGDKDRALEALERLAALNAVRAARYLNHPEIGLRGDPRAEAFRRKLGFPH